MARKLNPETPDEIREQIRIYHEKVNSWTRVGEVLGTSPSYAQQVASGRLNASASAIERWMTFLDENPIDGIRIIRQMVQVPVHEDEKITVTVESLPGAGEFEVIYLT